MRTEWTIDDLPKCNVKRSIFWKRQSRWQSIGSEQTGERQCDALQPLSFRSSYELTKYRCRRLLWLVAITSV